MGAALDGHPGRRDGLDRARALWSGARERPGARRDPAREQRDRRDSADRADRGDAFAPPVRCCSPIARRVRARLPLPDADFIAVCGPQARRPARASARCWSGILRTLEAERRAGARLSPRHGGLLAADGCGSRSRAFARGHAAGWRRCARAGGGDRAAGGVVIAAGSPRIPTIGAYRDAGRASASASSSSSILPAFRFRRGAPVRRQHEGEPGACGDGRSAEIAGIGHPRQLRPDTSEADVDRFLAEWRRIAERAGSAGRMIYLDYQATTPVAPEVAEAMQPWIEEKFANPHSPSRWGHEADGGDRGRAQAGREGDRPQGRQRRVHRQRDRGDQLGAQGDGRESAARAATGSSPSRPSMPPSSTPASGWRSRASTYRAAGRA